MTAEVIITNPNLLVLAADSAITLDTGRTVENHRKNFILSQDPPMAIMCYGNADIGGLYYNSLILDYRKRTNFKKLGTVEKISQNFFEYIEHKIKETGIDNLEILIDVIKTDIETINLELFETRHTSKEYLEILSSGTDLKLYELLKTKGILDKIDKNLFSDIIDDHFSEYENKDEIIDLLIKVSLREFDSSGFVIGGFNQDDLYPSYGSYLVYGVFNQELILIELNSETNYMNPEIIPFAQRYVIDAYFNGISKEYMNKSKAYINNILDVTEFEIHNELDKLNLTSEKTNASKEEFSKIIEKSKDYLNKITMENDENPLLDNKYSDEFLGDLSIEDAIGLGFNLIDMTINDQKLNNIILGVGGRIDLILMTKDSITEYGKKDNIIYGGCGNI